MSVLIKGMEMPVSCRYCDFRHMSITGNAFCTAAHETIGYMAERTKRLDSCPLVYVPPHGRLIDADALGADLLYDTELCARALDSGDIVDSKEAEDLQWQKDCKQNCAYYLTNAETIIEAEEGE